MTAVIVSELLALVVLIRFRVQDSLLDPLNEGIAERILAIR